MRPENILYFDNMDQGHYTPQLADFGLARNQQSTLDYCGTRIYAAPERFTKHTALPQSQDGCVVPVCHDHRHSPICPVPAFVYFFLRHNFRSRPGSCTEKCCSRQHGFFFSWHARTQANGLRRRICSLSFFHGRGLTTPRNQIKGLPAARAGSCSQCLFLCLIPTLARSQTWRGRLLDRPRLP